ncbi:glycosyltransferase [Caldicoprobacter algeriensis]|uniref:glycosyltransferase n=1 Tax=Caldicoprobacter algeriensis TaxID=699281 RepID=UPI00207A401C|nr:glycosyltransferase [Caldicoprobacter algeriensis]MCM8901630.1 glycosyltransferase [Caldicoprobacter algeriensis]
MKILHYFLGFPPLHDGGLMIYATDLAKEQLKMGHNVAMLMPGIYTGDMSKSEIKFYKMQEGLPIYQIINPQLMVFPWVNTSDGFIKQKSTNNYRDFLKKHEFKILHVHSLMGFPIELLNEAKTLNIKTVFTTHDYFGLCPSIDFFKYDNSLCSDYKNGEECLLCTYHTRNYNYSKRNLKILINKHYLSSYTINLMLRLLKKAKNNTLSFDNNIDYKEIEHNKEKKKAFMHFREYYKTILEKFDIVLFNSRITKSEYGKYVNLNNIKHEILNITHSGIQDNRNIIKYKPLISDKVSFLFMGYLNKKKGFFDLINVLNEIRQRYTNWELNIYGDCSDIDMSKLDKNFFKFHGKYGHEDLSNIFSNSSVLIIPSKWKETFGFIGLEAYSYGIPAVVSDNVGFTDLITNGVNGIIYKDDDSNENLKESLIKILEHPMLLKNYHEEILKGKFKYLMEEHCKEVLNCYESI